MATNVLSTDSHCSNHDPHELTLCEICFTGQRGREVEAKAQDAFPEPWLPLKLHYSCTVIHTVIVFTYIYGHTFYIHL